MSYSLIHDFNEMRWFIGSLEQCPNTFRVISLFSRQKYSSDVRSGHSELLETRILRVEDSLDTFVALVQRFEGPLGSYFHKDGKSVDNETLCVYLSLNPVCAIDVWQNLTKTFIDKTRDSLVCKNPVCFTDLTDSLRYSLFKSKTENYYRELDVDTKDPILIERVWCAIKPLIEKVFKIVETNGGYHIIFAKLSRADEKLLGNLFYGKNLAKWNYIGTDCNGKPLEKRIVEITSDPCVPIPGTIQGGFQVREIQVHQFPPRDHNPANGI